jgi:hypothetical protein
VPLKHEKFVENVRKKNGEHLEEGEQVEHAVGGQTGPVHISPVYNLIDTGKRFAGQLQSRLVVLTDRNLYVAYPGFFGQFEMKEVKAKYPRADAASHLDLRAGGLELDVDGESTHFRLGTKSHVKSLVEAAGGSTEAGA